MRLRERVWTPYVYLFASGSSTPLTGQIATYGTSRPDVGGIYGSRFTNSGYTTTFAGRANGTYTITVFARSAVTGTFSLVLTRTFTVI